MNIRADRCISIGSSDKLVIKTYLDPWQFTVITPITGALDACYINFKILVSRISVNIGGDIWSAITNSNNSTICNIADLNVYCIKFHKITIVGQSCSQRPVGSICALYVPAENRHVCSRIDVLAAKGYTEQNIVVGEQVVSNCVIIFFCKSQRNRTGMVAGAVCGHLLTA